MTDKKNSAGTGTSNAVVERGARTSYVKDELTSICKEMKAHVLQTFEISDLHDHEGHLTCKLYLEILKDFEQMMRTRISTGKAQEINLSKMN